MVNVIVIVSDLDGSVVKVEFFCDGGMFGVVISVLYVVSWVNVSVGSYILCVVVIDNNNVIVSMVIIIIIVNVVSGDIIVLSVFGGLVVGMCIVNSIVFSWSFFIDNIGGSGMVGYDVYCNGSLVGLLFSVSYVDGGLMVLIIYCYCVCVCDNVGNVLVQGIEISVIMLVGDGGIMGKWVIGYFIQWGIYGCNYWVKNIDSSGLVVCLIYINYVFGNVCNNCCEVGIIQLLDLNSGVGGDVFVDYIKVFSVVESVSGSVDIWDQLLCGNWNQFKQFKVKYLNLKVLILLGGWIWLCGFFSVV